MDRNEDLLHEIQEEEFRMIVIHDGEDPDKVMEEIERDLEIAP